MSLGKPPFYSHRSNFRSLAVSAQPVWRSLTSRSSSNSIWGWSATFFIPKRCRIPAPPVGTRGMVLGEATVELLAPCCRMVQLLDTPQDVPFFGKLLQREIIYRLLQGPQGDRLRSVATLADQNYRTAKAVNWLRENYEKTLNVDELASMTGMSRSTLHHHFRGLTAMSPLQFQKQLRLHAARQKMLTEELDAASAAFEVGYESPSQFNREYKRFFGQPPMRDIQALRACLDYEIFVTFTSEQLRSPLMSTHNLLTTICRCCRLHSRNAPRKARRRIHPRNTPSV